MYIGVKSQNPCAECVRARIYWMCYGFRFQLRLQFWIAWWANVIFVVTVNDILGQYEAIHMNLLQISRVFAKSSDSKVDKRIGWNETAFSSLLIAAGTSQMTSHLSKPISDVV